MLGFKLIYRATSIDSEKVLKFFNIFLDNEGRLTKLKKVQDLDTRCLVCNKSADIYAQTSFNPLRVVFLCSPSCLQEISTVGYIEPDYKVKVGLAIPLKGIIVTTTLILGVVLTWIAM